MKSFNHNHTCYFQYLHDIQCVFMPQITLYMHMLHFSTGRTIVPDVTDLMDRTWELDVSELATRGAKYCVMMLDDGTQTDIKRNTIKPLDDYFVHNI